MQYIIFADKRLMHIHDNSVVGSLDFGQERRWQFSNVLWRKTLSSAIAPSTALRAISRSPRRGSIPHRRSAMQAAPGKLALPHNVWVRGGRARRSGPAEERGGQRRLTGLCALGGAFCGDFVHCRHVPVYKPPSEQGCQCAKPPVPRRPVYKVPPERGPQCTKSDLALGGRFRRGLAQRHCHAAKRHVPAGDSDRHFAGADPRIAQKSQKKLGLPCICADNAGIM